MIPDDELFIIENSNCITYFKDYALLIKHRDYGPAIVWGNGDKDYYNNGLLHNTKGNSSTWIKIKSICFIHGKSYVKSKYMSIVL